jgi:hypothetical protein
MSETGELKDIVDALGQLIAIEGERRDIENQLLDLLRNQFGPIGFRITETALQPTGGNTMAPIAKAGVDLQILDDGKGVLYTLTPVNRSGNPEPLPAGVTVSASSSAPASLANAIQDPGDPNATPQRPPDTTGLVFLATVVQPVVDANGIVMTFSAPFGSTGADPVDVVADNSPVGFSIKESAL